MQAHKATVDTACSTGFNGHIDGSVLDDGFVLLANDAEAVNELSNGLDGGLRLPFADGGSLRINQRASDNLQA